jgi:hypothetical protein
MASIDPTTVRLSDSFLLSDFMGCDSVYRRGLKNQITDADDHKIAEGKHLAETLEQIQDRYGPISVSYGYISPGLSREIVTYQDPSKPSYHRWDAGAAADFIAHEWFIDDCAPIFLAADIALSISYSRMITYAESEAICFATRLSEKGTEGRQALYENRYMGERKPQHIKHNTTDKRRLQATFADVELSHPWRGQGYPSYHGGGRKQFEHVRVGRYALLSDFLYVPERVHYGLANNPWNGEAKSAGNFHELLKSAGAALSHIVETLGKRVSLVYGFERSENNERNWREHFCFEIVPPVGVCVEDVAEIVYGIPSANARIRPMRSGLTRVVVTGY